MADILDQATDYEMAAREQAVKQALETARMNALQPAGICHNCEDSVPVGRLFCDADCSADHELRTRANRRK